MSSFPITLLNVGEEKLPNSGVVCLCRGISYDSGHHLGWILAYIVDTGEEKIWVTGKQQEPVSVTEFAYLPH